jgi:hypothetical protein
MDLDNQALVKALADEHGTDDLVVVLGAIDLDGIEITVETVVEDWEAMFLNAPTNVAFCGPNLEFLAAACVGEEYLAIADLGVRGWPLRRPEVP